MSDTSIQLYSTRKFPPLSDILSLVSSVGLKNVEGYGGLLQDVPTMCAGLDAAGLSMPSAHIGLDMLADIPAVVATARTLGISRVICPSIPMDRRSQPDAEWVALAAQLDGIGKALKDAGLHFGWHNHTFEFVQTERGRLPIDILFEGAPDLEWQMDLAWVVRAGQTPADWMDRYGARITALHVKDLAPQGEAADEDGWADLGHGTVPWPEMMQAAREKTAASLFVLEHDNPSDAARFVTRSFATLQSL